MTFLEYLQLLAYPGAVILVFVFMLIAAHYLEK